MELKNGTVSTWRMPDGNLVKIEQYDALMDTAAIARERAAQGVADRYAVFAPARTIPGRSKPSYEKGIFLSLILRPSLFASQAGFLRILSGLALLETLEDHSDGKRIGIGWVSDIYYRGRRIGDTVVEGKLDSISAFEYLIISFRAVLNPKHFAPKLTDLVSMVFEEEEVALPSIMAKTLLDRFFRLSPSLQSPQKFMDSYRDKFVFRGHRILCRTENGKKQPFKVLGVEKTDGTLVVEDENGTVRNIANRTQVVFPKRIHMK